MTSPIVLNLGRPNPKQARFLASTARYTAYGGARGGGKSWAVRAKAASGALRYPGIHILILRRTYPELEQSMVRPLRKTLQPLLRAGLASYSASHKAFELYGGSLIQFGYLASEKDADIYQGQEYDWIFLDEATQFTERQFRTLAATLRGVNDFPKRFYLTCNPGGVGHMWVKRLFIDRAFRPQENPDDYLFIPATVEDNKILLLSAPDYLQTLELLPDDLRAAHRYGDWNALSGQFFSEFQPAVHVVPPRQIPHDWIKYRAIDYGLDMLACLWIAVDFHGRAWVYRELHQPGLIVSDAARRICQLTLPGESIACTFAPPDLWSAQKDTGYTIAELFATHGVPLVRANNSRVPGWLALKELLKPDAAGTPSLLICQNCATLIRHLPAIQHDPHNPSDCALHPHFLTHICDALRYFAQSRTLHSLPPSQNTTPAAPAVLCGGTPDSSYLYL